MLRLFLVVSSMILISVGCKKNDYVLNKPVAIDLVIPADSVKLNPTGYAPLSALVSFSSPVSGKTVIIVKGKNGAASDIKHVFNDEGLYHSVPVIGLYASFINTVNIRLINNSGDTVAKTSVNIQTGDLPPTLYTSIVADVFPTGQVEEGINLVSNFSRIGLPQPLIPLMVDNYGDIRWLLDYTNHPALNQLSYNNGIKRLRNGNFYFGDVPTDKLYEVDLLGKIVNTFDLSTTGYIFHHDIDEKPDGNFIVSVDKAGSTHENGVGTIEDYIVEIDRQTGSIKTVWDLKESLDEYRTALTDDTKDWIHVNSVLYDSTDNTIIISGRTQGVAKLTFDNKVKWILAAHKGWGNNERGEDLNKFLLTPLDAAGNRITDTAVLGGYADHSDFEWCWYQHSTIAMPNGDYMVFDNGSSRNYDLAAPRYSRAVEYKIDPVNMTIQQKWQYGKERGLETYSAIVSKVQYLPNTNHVLFCPGYQVMNTDGKGGKVVEVDYATKQVVSQLSFSAANAWGFHRAERMNAYP
jgi:arylsulfate sulfotransferase